MISLNVRYHRATALVLLAGLVSPALAQNAVGNGRALERPLQTRISNTIPNATNPPLRSFSSELAFREAIVTGTAPSGLSFRGEALPSRYEFRGELGDDALFAYRRDSLYSGLSGQGIRGTDALQYQFALTVGSRVPQSLAGQISYARAGEAERSSDPDQPLSRDLTGLVPALRRVADSETMMSAIEAGSSLVQPVRSISTFTANRSLQPTLVGVMQNRVTQQTAGQTASPLLGLQVVSAETLRNPSPLQQLRAPSLSAPAGAEAAAPPARAAYEELLDRYRNLVPGESAAPPTPGETPAWADGLIGLRRTLRGLPQSTARAMGMTPDPETEPTSAVGPLDVGLNPVDPREDDLPTFDREVLRMVREAGGMTDTLIPVRMQGLDRYVAYMQGAQDLLAKGRYFDAEERFISAISSRPGDVNASVGRAHAQIGAGLFLSAGLNVRQLLILHPEVAGMRYADALLPSDTRLAQLTPTLRDGLGSPSSGADCGLLLSYLGFQRGIEDDIRAGLDALAQRGDEADKRLAEMLRIVWLDEIDEGGGDSPADGG